MHKLMLNFPGLISALKHIEREVLRRNTVDQADIRKTALSSIRNADSMVIRSIADSSFCKANASRICEVLDSFSNSVASRRRKPCVKIVRHDIVAALVRPKLPFFIFNCGPFITRESSSIAIQRSVKEQSLHICQHNIAINTLGIDALCDGYDGNILTSSRLAKKG